MSQEQTPTARWWQTPKAAIVAGLAVLTAVATAIANFQTIRNFIWPITIALETSRPWLSVQAEVNQFAILTRWEKSRQILLPLKFSIKNYGQEPAINVRVYPSVVVHPGNARRGELAAPQKKTCEEGGIDSDKNPIGGITIFPNETGTIELGSGASGFENGQSALFSLLGCVIYNYGSGAHGQTGFRYMLGKVQDGKVWGVPFTEGPPSEPYSPGEELLKSGFPKDPPKVARIPIGELYFKPEDGGNYAK